MRIRTISFISNMTQMLKIFVISQKWKLFLCRFTGSPSCVTLVHAVPCPMLFLPQGVHPTWVCYVLHGIFFKKSANENRILDNWTHSFFFAISIAKFNTGTLSKV